MACGQPLQASSPPPDLDALLEAGIVCPKCDTYNEPSQKTCSACGENLSGLTGLLHAVDLPAPQAAPLPMPPAPTAQPAPAPTPAAPRPASPTPQPLRAVPLAEVNPTGTMPIELTPKRPTAPMASAVPASASLCPVCRAAMPAGQGVCLSCGQRVAPPPPALVETPSNLSIRLRLVRGYGREDSTFPVGPQGLTIGRRGAMVNIADDPFLAPRHLALRLDQGLLVAEDLGGLNGTFLRIRAQTEIKQGAEFIAGNQRFALLGLGGPTTDVRMPVSQDTRPYGGPVPKQLFVALRLHHATAAGKPVGGSVILRTGPIIAIGQRGCDLNFPTDPAMAAHHLELHLKPTGIGLVEIGSTSGVFLRLRRPAVLKNGDELLAGDEIFRVEIG